MASIFIQRTYVENARRKMVIVRGETPREIAESEPRVALSMGRKIIEIP